MQKQRLKLFASLAIFAACLAFLCFRYLHLTPRIEGRPHAGIGTALAEQAMKQAGGGGRIVLIAPDTHLFDYPGAEVQLKAFHAALRRAQREVAATYEVKLDPLRPPRAPAVDLVEIFRKYSSESDVVVSLMGPGLLTSEQKLRLPARHARLVALCSGEMPRQVNLVNLFDENLLHVAIISRPNPDFNKPTSDESKQWFDHYYQIATARNAATVLELVKGGTP